MQYRICEVNSTLSIELMFNNNIPRLFKDETIVSRILQFCKATIDSRVDGEPYRAVFNVINYFFQLYLVPLLLGF